MRKGIFLLIAILASMPIWAVQKIKSVNFFQKDEVSKLVIELDGPVYVERKHIKSDKQILLDLKNATAGPRVLRGIDTSEFPGSSVYISGYKKPGSQSDIRFAIQLRDNVNSFVEMVGNKVILNIESRFGVFNRRLKKGAKTIGEVVEPQKHSLEASGRLHIPRSNNILDILANLTLSGPKRYVGKRISINVNDMPVSDLLRIIAETSGFNIIIDDAVKDAKPLSLKLTNLPWDQILDTILGLSDLAAEKHANILTVTTRSKAESDLKKKLVAEKSKEAQKPLVTKIFPISYGKIEDISKIVKSYLTKNRGSVESDARTNYLIVNDTIDAIEKIKNIIEALDTETAQVLIEARIVEITNRDELNIGLTDGLKFSYNPFATPAPYSGIGAGDFSFSSAGGSGILGFTINNLRRLTNLDFNLELAQTKNFLKIISSPRVVTQNKQTANLVSSEQVGYTTSVSVPATGQNPSGVQSTAQSATADISLTVTPQVTNEGSINLAVQISKADFLRGLGSRNRAPDTLTRSINTNVLVDNGSTISIGGLYKTSRSRSEKGIPILKDIPIIGWLFKTKYNPAVTKDELMVFITPRIINQEEAGLTGANLSAIKSNSFK